VFSVVSRPDHPVTDQPDCHQLPVSERAGVTASAIAPMKTARIDTNRLPRGIADILISFV
jgi:hypothetical protein